MELLQKLFMIQPVENADPSDTLTDMELHNTGAMNCTKIALKPIYEKTYLIKLNVFRNEHHLNLINISFYRLSIWISNH